MPAKRKAGKSLNKKAVSAIKASMPARSAANSKNKTIVIALGGNALVRRGQTGTIEEQLANINHAMEQVAKLAGHGYHLVITHGNGPQLDNILIQQESTVGAPKMPLYASIAQSQGLIGYMIQEALYNKLHSMGIKTPVVTLITQSLVDRNDKSFKSPGKQIGPLYPDDEDMPVHWHVAETMRGVRRIVPSPRPKKVIEAEAVKALMDKAVVVACGGGGIPVVRDKIHISGKGRMPGLYGVEALIDKDLATAELAKELKADLLVMLTDVDGVYVNWDEPRRRMCLDKINIKRMRRLLDEGHFPFGSMRPKVEASLNFLESGGKKVLITDADRLAAALRGKAGTVIEP